MALPLFVFEKTDSTLATAAIFAARIVPSIVIGSVAGVFVDRWDRKRTMIWADLLRAAVVMLLVIAGTADQLWLAFIAAPILGTIGLFFNPAENALLPLLVEEEERVPANALNALNDNLGRLIGPVVGASLFAASGLAGAAIVDAISYLASAMLIRLITADTKVALDAAIETGRHAIHRVLDEWRFGLVTVRRSRTLMILFGASVLGAISEGAFITLALAPFVLRVLGGTEAQVGWISAAQAIGGLIAGLVVARTGKNASKRKLAGFGMIGLGLADTLQFNALHFVDPGTTAVLFAMGCMMLAGFPVVAMSSGSLALFQDNTEDAYRGRVFGALTAVQGIAMLVGLTMAGILGDHVSFVAILTCSSLLWVVAGVSVFILLPPTSSEPV